MHPLYRSILWAGHVASSGILLALLAKDHSWACQLCCPSLRKIQSVHPLPQWLHAILSNWMWSGGLWTVRIYRLGKTEFRKRPPSIYTATRRTSFMLGGDLPMLPVTCWTVNNPNIIVGELQWIWTLRPYGEVVRLPSMPPIPTKWQSSGVSHLTCVVGTEFGSSGRGAGTFNQSHLSSSEKPVS